MTNDNRLKLFYTRAGEGVVECCVVVDGEFMKRTMTPTQAIQFATDLLNQAIESERRGKPFTGLHVDDDSIQG